MQEKDKRRGRREGGRPTKIRQASRLGGPKIQKIHTHVPRPIVRLEALNHTMTRAFSSSVLPLMQYWRGMLVWLCLWCGGPNHFSSTGWQQQRSVVHAWTTTTPARSSPLSLLRRRRRSRTTPLPHSTTTTTTSTHRVVLHASADSESSNHKKQLTLFSPSKINLFLRIVRKRPDGYHDLASLFQAIGLGDRLDLELVDSSQDDVNEIAFTCNMPGVPVDETNLVVRAIRLMQSKTNTTTTSQFAAHLEKQVPAQAGLGGGSANAATAMWGVNELLGRPATLEQVRCRSIVVLGPDRDREVSPTESMGLDVLMV